MQRSALFAVLFFGLLPILVIAGLIVGQTQTAGNLDHARMSALHTRNIIEAATALEIAIEEAERTERGYVLTGDPHVLAEYEISRAEAAKSLQRVDEVTRTDPVMQPQLAALDGLMNRRLNDLDARVSERQAAQAAAPALDSSGEAENGMRQILDILSQFIAHENNLRETDRDSINRAIIAGNKLVLLAGVTSFAALSFAAFALYAAYRRSRRSEAILQATLNSVREGVAAFDEADRLIAWNQLFTKLHRAPEGVVRTGMPAQQLEDLEQDRPDPIAPDLRELKHQAAATGQPMLVERKRADGTIIELSLVTSSDGGFVTSYIDVTQARRTEAAYRQAQRMEALGRMTGGIAHDFNNLLTIVIGNLDLLGRRTPASDRSRRLIDQALLGAERGAKLTQQLMAFARRQPLEPKTIDLKALLPDLAELIAKTLGPGIEARTVIAEDLWAVQIDPTQFESALLNLALNARDAMTSGGVLTIEATNRVITAVPAGEIEEAQAGDYVLMAVTDTGTGMPPEVIARAFEPFYTTKSDGKGNGLGLSMVYGFARQSGGHVKIRSAIGRGTTMELYLPRSVQSPALPALMPSAIGRPSDSGIVLLVEDDAEVRHATRELLVELGYQVIEAEDGRSALAIVDSPQPIDLLFSDVVMPGPITSMEMAAEASRLRPQMAILFTSGYTYEEINAEGRLDPGLDVLTKPYRSDQLGQKIRASLNPSKRLAQVE
jgi:signal transduction histidine kinase/CheY-like chemotaxis protein